MFIIGDQERIAQAGDILHFPPGTWHGATMLEGEVIQVDIFSPIREDFLKKVFSLRLDHFCIAGNSPPAL